MVDSGKQTVIKKVYFSYKSNCNENQSHYILTFTDNSRLKINCVYRKVKSIRIIKEGQSSILREKIRDGLIKANSYFLDSLDDIWLKNILKED